MPVAPLPLCCSSGTADAALGAIVDIFWDAAGAVRASCNLQPLAGWAQGDAADGCAKYVAGTRALLDSMLGDGTLFARADEVDMTEGFLGRGRRSRRATPHPSAHAVMEIPGPLIQA